MTNIQTTSHEGWLLSGSPHAPGLPEAISKIFQAPLEHSFRVIHLSGFGRLCEDNVLTPLL